MTAPARPSPDVPASPGPHPGPVAAGPHSAPERVGQHPVPEKVGQHPAPATDGTLPVSYVLPLRWSDDHELADLTDYLRWLAARVEVTVVDASPPGVFARHAAAWRGLVRHVPPDPALRGTNGKVLGVLTGVCLARHEHVVIADDDVRYDDAGLHAVHRLLDRVDLVRPQNHFDPLPWHAYWDTGRILLNRAFGADYPGTLAVRRSTFRAMGGYDPDVLFENLELIRTVRAYGGTEAAPPGLYVRRLPPVARHFRGQRVRQAYDDLAQPVRLAVFLAVLPALGAAVRARRTGLLFGAVAATVALAEAGRRRAGGTRVFPPATALAAPFWVLERAACSWLAVGQRLLCGGVRYAGTRIARAAHSERALRQARLRAPR
ncbi:glycosyltransferase [Micromonospora cathayae]|uniref:Glycosyltransferase family 2 protein n=1 Tax=Micromonospora cathayae TaxID=3028804 RepID=A0ABY7ZPK2_9ACTN|nr:glycosyltransferase family 2 protein [Micromonospora sp. HUAS 3]WDZ84825.1 glycosyltransferase family 2 protein [Micromonospora sp. HUAS 3]